MKLYLKSSLLLFGLSLIAFCHAEFKLFKDYAPYPLPDSGYVSDHASLLTPSEEEDIEHLLWEVEEQTNVEIIVVTIDSISDYPETKNDSIESFATALFNTYGIGNMPKNDGILLLIAKNDRKARIELGAYYKRDRDHDAKRIMNEVIIPEFKDGNYADGIIDGTDEIIEEFTGAWIITVSMWDVLWLALAGIVLIMVGSALARGDKKSWGYVIVGFGIILILLALYLLNRILRAGRRRRIRGHSSTWSAGGLGGFGGGSSGGGGATGSW